MMSDGSVVLESEEKAVFEDVVAIDGVGAISFKFFFGGDFSSPERAASPSDSSSHQSGMCGVM